MAEALFYHLTSQTLEHALPDLLSRTLERGWRAAVRSGSVERMEALDRWLWTYKEESFLPHGTARDPFPESQPVYLTTEVEAPNNPNVLFLVDMADTDDFEAFERTAILFSDRDDAAKTFAREQWMRASDSVDSIYWKQDESGGWHKELEKKKG